MFLSLRAEYEHHNRTRLPRQGGISLCYDLGKNTLSEVAIDKHLTRHCRTLAQLVPIAERSFLGQLKHGPGCTREQGSRLPLS